MCQLEWMCRCAPALGTEPLGVYEQGRHWWSKRWTAQVIYCYANHPEECLWVPSTTEVSRANNKSIDQSGKPNTGIRRILLWLSWDAPKSPPNKLGKCHRLSSESQRLTAPSALLPQFLNIKFIQKATEMPRLCYSLSWALGTQQGKEWIVHPIIQINGSLLWSSAKFSSKQGSPTKPLIQHIRGEMTKIPYARHGCWFLCACIQEPWIKEATVVYTLPSKTASGLQISTGTTATGITGYIHWVLYARHCAKWFRYMSSLHLPTNCVSYYFYFINYKTEVQWG